MSGTDRRTFLQRASAALTLLALPGCLPEREEARDDAAASFAPAEHEVLLAMAEVLLPSELGPGGRQRVVAEFRQWTAEYDPVPELMHGYGSAEIQYGPPDPAPGWSAQLRGLDLEARRAHGAPFAALPAERRRTIVRAHLASMPGQRLPTPVDAHHVAVALLAYFYDSPAATDLCYRARIGRNTCRVLAQSPERPAPLPAGG